VDLPYIDCFNCHQLGHRAADCPLPPAQGKGKGGNFKGSKGPHKGGYPGKGYKGGKGGRGYPSMQTPPSQATTTQGPPPPQGDIATSSPQQ